MVKVCSVNLGKRAAAADLDDDGGVSPPLPLGINYEGGKCVEHALRQPGCIAAYNCQIAMDAPFEAGQDAPEQVRALGRSELTLGATDPGLRDQLMPVLAAAAAHAGSTSADLVIQVARGRSAAPFWDAVVAPVLVELGATGRARMVTGYRTTDYPVLDGAAPAVYVNIGMFGRLTPGPLPGDVFAVSTTYAVAEDSTPGSPRLGRRIVHSADGGFHANKQTSTPPLKKTQVLMAGQQPAAGDSALGLLPPCRLISVPDHFPFVTDEHYSLDLLLGLAEAL